MPPLCKGRVAHRGIKGGGGSCLPWSNPLPLTALFNFMGSCNRSCNGSNYGGCSCCATVLHWRPTRHGFGYRHPGFLHLFVLFIHEVSPASKWRARHHGRRCDR